MTTPTPGTVRRHPEWPVERSLAFRTIYYEGQYPGFSPWILVTLTRSEFVSDDVVADWPEVTITEGP